MLSVLSVLGVVQSAVLSIIFFKKRSLSVFNNHLSALFLLLALAMLTIRLSESVITNARYFLEVFEFSLTFSAGPVLYTIALGLLGKNISWKKVTVHFIPAILFLGISTTIALEILSFGAAEKLPVMVPVIHMQVYTVWLCRILMKNYRKEDFQSTAGFTWLVIISILLISIHVAQWVRFFYADIEWLKLIVPATAFLAVYILAFYGFLKSEIFFGRMKNQTSYFTNDEKEENANVLLRIIDEEKVYQNHELTLEEFSRIAGMPAYKVSHLINKTLNTGFNEWINSYRIEKVKGLLNDPSKSYLTIEAIAQEAGFNSRSAFYHAFKKETNMTPAEFRSDKRS